MSLHVFHTDDSNEYWIAESAEDVRAQQEALHGCPDDVEDIYEVDDDHVMPIVWDEDEPGEVETHTCAEWVAKKGRGLLVACEP